MNPQIILSVISNFTAAFLSAFFTAMPFLMLGGLVSGLVAVFVRDDEIPQLVPKQVALLPIAGALLGLAFPVGQVGAIPVARRLIQKGLPLSAAMAFVVAGPVVNLVTAASTFAAYGLSPILIGRLVVGLITGIGVGFLFSRGVDQRDVLRAAPPIETTPREGDEDWRQALRRAARLGGDTMFDIGPYLVAGALLVALLQVLGAEPVLTELNDDSTGGVVMMGLLALIQSAEPVADAFLSLLQAPEVNSGALLTYLAPIIDLQALVVMLAVFKPKIPAYLLVLSTLTAMLIGLFMTFYLPW